MIKDPSVFMVDKELAQFKLDKLPKDSSRIRINRRCEITGKSRGVYRIVGMCRNMFRHYVMKGDVPGFKKASW